MIMLLHPTTVGGARELKKPAKFSDVTLISLYIKLFDTNSLVIRSSEIVEATGPAGNPNIQLPAAPPGGS